MKLKRLFATVTAMALAASAAAVMTLAVVADEEDVRASKAPTFEWASGGARINCLQAHEFGHVGINAKGTFCKDIGSSAHATLKVLVDTLDFTEVAAVRAEFFFNWEDKSWGADGVANPWVHDNHLVSINLQGAIELPRGSSIDRHWVQNDFKFVEGAAGAGEISYGAESVVIEVPFNHVHPEDFDYFRVSATTWGATTGNIAPGYAIIHLIDEDGEVIPFTLPYCEDDGCACGGVAPTPPAAPETPGTATTPAATTRTGSGGNPTTGVAVAILPGAVIAAALAVSIITKKRRV